MSTVLGFVVDHPKLSLMIVAALMFGPMILELIDLAARLGSR